MATLSTGEWNGIVSRVRENYPNLTRQWFEQLHGASLEHGVLEVFCANVPQQRYLGAHCIRPFCEAAQEETGCLISVRFALADRSAESGGNGHAAPQDTQDSLPPSPDVVALDPEYEFDQFVTGPCNRLAHAACIAVSEAPGETYNPLFIHGDVGLGKTHLLQAICQRAQQRVPAPRILYLSCEAFTNHFIESVERGDLHHFRFRYRHVDILVIDDIQFLAGRERTQEELFHTFNTLYQARKQIVLSADCTPREIPSLADRLVSRFSWGLVARIDCPCLETRMAIVRKKARRRNIPLGEAVIACIAATCATNARELEGAITTLDAVSQQLGREIDLSSARAALATETHNAHKPVAIGTIVDTVSEHFGVKKSELQGKRRSKSIAFPRQICMHLAREMTAHSLEEIGSHFGGRDHTTVMHATRRIAQLRQEDAGLSALLMDLKNRIAGQNA